MTYYVKSQLFISDIQSIYHINFIYLWKKVLNPEYSNPPTFSYEKRSVLALQKIRWFENYLKSIENSSNTKPIDQLLFSPKLIVFTTMSCDMLTTFKNNLMHTLDAIVTHMCND